MPGAAWLTADGSSVAPALCSDEKGAAHLTARLSLEVAAYASLHEYQLAVCTAHRTQCHRFLPLVPCERAADGDVEKYLSMRGACSGRDCSMFGRRESGCLDHHDATSAARGQSVELAGKCL